ncbi:multidrug ABC transporter ATP-binding protein [Kocuria dechangensis]|uniref:Fatty acid ABC transporter ATP-binding/permease protein n=1 Tax=Kocuria dechangensis TaxID=1176249 RepID=A0A917GEL0_9MICC|nr:ABC transporter ATP-binding protein [Kocuria dechangensis]GGG41866.1 multidrug ABC transporter ATP-binding protein [Kocuria dechangensis]
MAAQETPPRRAQHFWRSARRLVGLLRPHRPMLAVVVASGVVSVVLTVWAPLVLGRAMDVIFTGVVGRAMPAGASKEEVAQGLRDRGETNLADMVSAMDLVPGAGIDFAALARFIVAVLGMYLVASLLMWAQGWLLNRIVMRVVHDLRGAVEAKLNRLPLGFFDTRQRGDVLSRVTNDIDNVQTALQQSFTQLVQSLLTVVGIVVMMFVVSWQLALVALVALPLSAAAAGFIGVRAQRLFTEQWRATGALNGHIEESFSGHELITLFGREAEMGERFDERNEQLYRASFGAQFVSGTIMPVMQFVTYLTYVGIAVLGGLRVASGQLSLGAATAFIQYSREFTQPLAHMAGMANSLQSGVASAERAFELLDAQEQRPDTARAHLPGRPRGHVRFEAVDFAYDPAEPLIRDLSLEARPGQTVAIVGPTGAGKTTLVNLVLRFYELDAGRITLDGVDITDLSRAELRSAAGMVLQDAWLFGGSIRENIRYGRLDATDEEVLDAARATYVDRFVRTLPQGYDTVVDEEGSNVSAGEKQLITIARAFLAGPSLLILDEATSSVDTRTELLVQKAMAALRSDRTSFVIAHRLSTVRDADIILVMEEGRIVEQGTHEELLAARGAYAALYRDQFHAPSTADAPDDAPEPAPTGVPAGADHDSQETPAHDTP